MTSHIPWALALFVIGLLTAVVEVVLPSAGLLAVVSVACLLGSLVLAYQVGAVAAAVLGAVELVCVPLVVYLAFKFLPRTSFGRDLFLEPPPKPGGSTGPAVGPATRGFEGLLGQEGVAVTMLRPSGTAELNGSRYSVVTRGEMIAEGTRVRVVEVEGVRIVVEAVGR